MQDLPKYLTLKCDPAKNNHCFITSDSLLSSASILRTVIHILKAQEAGERMVEAANNKLEWSEWYQTYGNHV
jgi:hypothetical protein